MICEYVSDVQSWEPWQREYRYGVILIYPPEPLRSTVNALRARHDPRSQAACDAHVSLTLPLAREPGEADWRQLQGIAARARPVTVRYGPLRHYLPHPGVCLTIEPQRELDQLRAALESADIFGGCPPRKFPFSAHMTIAEFISVDETTQLMAQIGASVPRGEFLCTALSYAVPDSTFRFHEGALLSLGR